MDLEILRSQVLSRRTFVKGAAAVAGGGLLAACGSATPTATSSTPVTVQVTNMPDKKADPFGYSIWSREVDDFQKKNPHYRIKGLTYGFDPTTFYTQFAAGRAADAFQTWFTEPQRMIAHHIVSDIDSLFKSSPYADIFQPDAVKVVTGPDGHIYGLPYGVYKLGLMYNRTLFKQAGLDPDKPPTTWDDFRAYAKRISDKTGQTGFTECTTANQGGWRFTNWLYSAGGQAESYSGDKTTAIFNGPEGVAALQFLKDMRWSDKSMKAQTANMQQGDTANLVATGKAGMCIGGNPGDYFKGKGSIDFLGLGPMPQNNGVHGVLYGGNAWMFNAKSSADLVKGGFAFISYMIFDLDNYEASDKAAIANNKAVGFPAYFVYNDAYAQKLLEIDKKYANMPLENYTTYLHDPAHLTAEPRIHTQDMYHLLDPVMQAIFTDPKADPAKLLNDTAQQFQTRFLDTGTQ